MYKHKFTGWLIFFMVWLGISGINGLGALDSVEKTWRPYMADYPSLQNAVLASQAVTGAGIAAWLFTAWILYQRESGTLKKAQMSLLAGTLLRLVGLWSIILFGGLPAEIQRRLAPNASFVTAIILLFTGSWYVYLIRSQRVQEIYSD
jgi:hypothetical protein